MKNGKNIFLLALLSCLVFSFNASAAVVGNWTLDDCTGSTLSDFSGNNYDATADAGSWTTNESNCISGCCYYCDGATHASLGTAPAMHIGNYSAFTFCAWQTKNSEYGDIFSDNSFYIINGQHKFSPNAQGLTNDSVTTSDGAVWRHLCVTVDGTGLKLYVNGSMEGEDTAAPAPADMEGNTYFCSRAGSGGELTGTLDEMLLFNTALNEGEIAGLFNSYEATTTTTTEATTTTTEVTTTTTEATTTTTTTTLPGECNPYLYTPCTDIPELWCNDYYQIEEGSYYDCSWNVTNGCLADTEECTHYCYGELLETDNCTDLIGYDCYDHYEEIEGYYYECSITELGCTAVNPCEVYGGPSTTTTTTTTTTTLPACDGAYTLDCSVYELENDCILHYYVTPEFIVQCSWYEGNCFSGRTECIAECPALSGNCTDYIATNVTECESHYQTYEDYSYACMWFDGEGGFCFPTFSCTSTVITLPGDYESGIDSIIELLEGFISIIPALILLVIAITILLVGMVVAFFVSSLFIHIFLSVKDRIS